MTQQVEALLEEALRLLRSQQPPAEVPQTSTPLHGPLAWGKKVSQTFKDRVWWIADELTKAQGSLFDANSLMGIIAWESNKTFSPSVRPMRNGKPISSATGLIQFMDATAQELGTTTAKLAAMTAEDQLNYVYRYFLKRIKERGPLRDIADMYMAVLWPAGIGKPSEFALWVKGTQAFAVNSGLDANKDSKVTKAEAAAAVTQRLAEGMKGENYG